MIEAYFTVEEKSPSHDRNLEKKKRPSLVYRLEDTQFNPLLNPPAIYVENTQFHRRTFF